MWHLCLCRYLSAKLKSGEVGAKWYESERGIKDGAFLSLQGVFIHLQPFQKLTQKLFYKFNSVHPGGRKTSALNMQQLRQIKGIISKSTLFFNYFIRSY